MKKTIILFLTILLISNMLPVNNGYVKAEVTNPIIENVSVDNKVVTAGDTVKVSVKLIDPASVNYIDAWYIAPVTKNDIHINLTYNIGTGLYEGNIPIYAVSESGEYHLSRMVFYGDNNIIGDLRESELFVNGDFLVTGTNGEDLLENVSVEKSKATAGDIVKVRVKLTGSVGVNYIDAWYKAPITKNDIHINLTYNIGTGLYEGSIPIYAVSESGEYHLSRMAFYGGGNITDLHGSELFQQGNFSVSGTSGEGVFESISVSMKEATVGDVVEFNVKVREKGEINYISLWVTSPVSFKTIYIDLYYNSESDSFVASLPIDSESELGDYNINRLTIYSSGVTYDYIDYENKLENGKFTVFSEENPPTFSSLSVSKNEAGSGESIDIIIGATDDTNLKSATVNYLSPSQSIVSIPLQYDGTYFRGEYYVDDNTELGNWTVDSVEIKDTNENITIVKASKTDLTAGSFFVKDVKAPMSPTVNEVTNQSTSVTGNAEGGSSVEVTVDGVVIGTGITGYDGKFSVSIPVQKADKELVITVKDKAGNVSVAATIIVKDVTAPDKPVVNEVTDKATLVTGQAEAGAEIEVKVNGLLIGNGTAGEDGKFSVAIPVQKAGVQLAITSEDKAGNVSAAATIVVKDVTAPDKPVVNEVTDKATSVTGQAEAGSKIEVKVNGLLIGYGTADTDRKFTVTIPVQKAGVQLAITSEDKAENVSAAATIVVKDVTAPDKPVVNEVTDKATSVTGQTEAGAKVEVKVDGSKIGSSTAGTDGKFTVTIPVQKAGAQLAVTATDKAGNVSEATTVVVKDVIAPGKPAVNEVTDKDSAVSGQAEAGSKVEVKVSGGVIGSGTAGTNGDFKVTIPVQKVGTELVVTVVDQAGNVSEGSKITVKDITAPGNAILDELTDRETVVTGTAELGATVIAKVSGAEIGRGVADSSGKFTITIPKQAAGKVVEVYAVDKAGNVSVAAKVSVNKKLVSLIGETRYATAVKVAQAGWKTADTVLLVNGFAIVDGLTATPLATAKDAPILLTAADSIPQVTLDEITRLKAKEIILIGGKGVITPKVESELVAKGYKVTRIGGQNRKDTSLLIAKELDKVIDVSTIYVAYGWGEPDALSIAAQAGLKKQPIILADKTAVPAETFAWLKTESLSDAYFIGGDGVVAPAIVSEVDRITSGNVLTNRLSGLNRHETNAKVISKFYPEAELTSILVAKSETASLVDALAAGPLAAKLGSPVLLVSSYVGLLPAQRSVLASKHSKYVHQIGGGVNPAAVSEAVQ
ncbi:Ig-like domain-containing protein [Neobacillus sp. YX16]|uniref:Ig-like domain-containing protein n=1 Tax=Neobacillus sp. YX16 TaxID=3047874 RepID=UPI0024C28A2E|nr:Ig-like domain-containing protein [Neobacillus sp. YX16]WHZ02792.1 Ig-like domain-containing protein [Neobacillus sp. YX16]